MIRDASLPTAPHRLRKPLRRVCTENLTYTQPAEDEERFDAPGPLNRARDRRIFIQ
jgi:hypothetical protein